MFPIGARRQHAAAAKTSPCQLVNKWETTDRLERLSPFINCECRLNRRSISEDCPIPAGVWRVWIGLGLAAPLSVFVGRPGPISNVSQPRRSQALPGQNRHTLYCIPPQHATPPPPPPSPSSPSSVSRLRSSFLFPSPSSPSVYTCRAAGFVSPE